MALFRKSGRTDEERLRSFDDALRDQHSRISKLEDAFVDLLDKHMRLRGRVYGAGVHKRGVADVPEPEPESKEELRKRLGIGRGKPYAHSE